MKEIIRYGLTLSLICALSGAALAAANLVTRSRIIAQAQAEEDAGLKEIFPQAARFEAIKKQGQLSYYKAYNADGSLAGVVFKAEQKGYSSQIQTLAGMNADGVISAIKVISQNETPGLGAQVSTDSFQAQFKSKNIADLDQVQAISGATISSRAVIESVKKKAQEIKELMTNDR